MADIVQQRIIDGFSNIFDGFLWIQWRNDFVLTRAHFVRGQNTDFTANDTTGLAMGLRADDVN